MISLSQRQSQIIQLLLNKNDYIVNSSISDAFGISERTVRYDLQQIKAFLNENGYELKSVPNKGTRIIADSEEKKKIERLLLSNRTISNKERDDLLVLSLLTDENCTYESIANAADVSRHTVVNGIDRLEERLNELKLELVKSKGTGIGIKGNECDIRNSLLSIINSNDYHSYLFEKIIEKFYNEDNKKKAREIINKVQDSLKLSFFETDKLEIAIAYMFERIKENKQISELTEAITNIRKDNKFNTYIKVFNDIDLNENEKVYLASLFMNSKNRSLEKTKEDGGISHDIALMLMEELEKLHPLDKNEKNRFLLGLTSHLDVALYRLRNSIPIHNMLRDQIRICLPLTYDFTKKQLIKCEDKFNVSFNEDEISYIAMYVGSTFETSVKLDNKINVMLVCSFGTTTSSILESRMRQTIPDCYFAGPFSKADAMKYLNNNDVDLIISTNDDDYGDIKTIVVNPLLYKEDVDYIRSQLFEINYDKMCQSFLNSYAEIHKEDKIYIRDIIPEKYIQICKAVDDWKESIKIAAKPLLDDKKIEKRYIDRMIAAVEELGTYMVLLEDTAFVHAGIEDGIIEECCSLLVMNKAVKFGEKNFKMVRNIVVIGIKEKHKTHLLDLVNILNSNNNLEVLKSKDISIDKILSMHD